MNDRWPVDLVRTPALIVCWAVSLGVFVGGSASAGGRDLRQTDLVRNGAARHVVQTQDDIASAKPRRLQRKASVPVFASGDGKGFRVRPGDVPLSLLIGEGTAGEPLDEEMIRDAERAALRARVRDRLDDVKQEREARFESERRRVAETLSAGGRSEAKAARTDDGRAGARHAYSMSQEGRDADRSGMHRSLFPEEEGWRRTGERVAWVAPLAIQRTGRPASARDAWIRKRAEPIRRETAYVFASTGERRHGDRFQWTPVR